MIANDNLIAALEIVELYCEQLHVRANILDHLAFSQKKKKHVRQKSKAGGVKGAGNSSSKSGGEREGGSGGGGWGIWKMFGYSSNPPRSEGTTTTTKQQQDDAQIPEDTNTTEDQRSGPKEDASTEDTEACEVYIDPELDQAAAVMFYSYTHIPRDIPGLPEVRAKLALRWGNDFANKVQDDESPVKLPEELVSRLRVQRAPESLVEMYLKEIARSHGIPWNQDSEDEDHEGGGESEMSSNQKRQPADISVVPGLETSDPIGETKPHKPAMAGGSESNDSGIPEVDELARRFAALKK